MNNFGYIASGLIFPVTENGEKIYYVTDAPLEVITPAFLVCECTEDFCKIIEGEGYRINKYSCGVELNFDNK